MSGNMNITIDARPCLTELARVRGLARRPGVLMNTLLGAAAEAAKKHFSALNDERNAHGSNFYGRWARDAAFVWSVSDDKSSGALEIKDRDGALRHKITGGTVKPRRTRYLLIPVSETAKRNSATATDAKIPGLFFARGRREKPLLATREGAKLVVHYVLLKSVTHRPRPEVMPPEKAFAAAVQEACEGFAEEVSHG